MITVKLSLKKYIPHIILFVSTVATVGSLFFSEAMGFPPCVLCWYQRIFMYPLILIAFVAIVEKDEKFTRYVLPLIIPGWLIAFYHNLLYYNIIPEAQAPCQAGISCTSKYIEWFGFVTIPFLSLAAFTLVAGLAIWHIKSTNK